MAKSKTSPAPVPHHYVRTTVSALFGAIAMLLVSASILVVWANRTLTDTTTYVQTVGPVIERPELQDFVANQVTDQLLQSASPADLATTLLPGTPVAGQTPEQLQSQLRPVIHDSVTQILRSPQMTAVWKSTNQNAHAELIKQLDANAPEVTLDLSPLVDTVLVELKQTKLAPVADKIELKPSSAKLDLKGSSIEKIHKYYLLLKTATLAIVGLTILFIGLSIWISVHHVKTLRRMLTSTGVSALLVAGFIALPAVVQLPAADPARGRLVVALAATLLHGLQVACVILGVVCVLLAIGSKLYERARARA